LNSGVLYSFIGSRRRSCLNREFGHGQQSR
jgi:hypothetical protein